MGDRQKKVIGFDYFPEEFAEQLEDAIHIFDNDRFIPYKPRVILVKGDILQTVPEYIENNPNLRISLLHIDVDLYQPTLIGLQHLWQRVVTKGIVLFDGYSVSPWAGESRAIDEFFMDHKVIIKRLDWCSSPGGYIVKE